MQEKTLFGGFVQKYYFFGVRAEILLSWDIATRLSCAGPFLGVVQKYKRNGVKWWLVTFRLWRCFHPSLSSRVYGMVQKMASIIILPSSSFHLRRGCHADLISCLLNLHQYSVIRTSKKGKQTKIRMVNHHWWWLLWLIIKDGVWLWW